MPRSEQATALSRFMIQKFAQGITYKYSHLLSAEGSSRPLDEARVSEFFMTMVQRSQAVPLQFKKVCCIIIKFLECCDREVNYMKFLRHDLKKLIVVGFILSVPNAQGNEGERIVRRERCYELYSRMTGLSVRELTNCCAIVRPVLIRRGRAQRSILRQRQRQSSSAESSSSLPPSPSTAASGSSTSLSFAEFSLGSGTQSYPHLHSSHTLANEGYLTVNPTDIFRDSITTSSISNGIPLLSLFSPTGQGQDTGIVDSRQDQEQDQLHQNSTGQRNADSNGYVLPTELAQFNEMGIRLVRDCFRVV